VVSLFLVLREIPGGWSHVVALAAPLGKLQIFDFRICPPAEFFTRTYSFWAGIIGGCFLTTASHGTEQLLVQRLLSARDEKQSRAALFSSWVVIFVQFTLFLIVGVCLFTLYKDHGWTPPAVPDSIYPRFIWERLPPGLSGLLIAAILAAAMSNLSAALNSLASTTVMDFLRPLGGTESGDESAWLKRARMATVGWGVILAGIALLARNWGGVLQAGLSIASIIYGSLLGVFLLGLLTRRVGELAAMFGMVAGLLLMLYVRFATPIAFTWYVLIGTSMTFAAGILASFVIQENRSRAAL
jgi:Na+/proline symporter